MTNKTELLPWRYCPECGSEEIRHEEGEHKQCAICYQEWFSSIDYSDVVRKHLGDWKANAEDVRAVVDEPVDNEQTVYLIVFDDYDVRPETVIGEAAARQRYTQLSSNWNAHLFVKLESNSRDDPHAKSNYRHPQRQVVMPERKPQRITDAYAEGWNAYRDEYKRLNP